MNKPRISAIAAIGQKRELGKNNQLLWHISEDLQRFKKITSGHPVIMGRKTFESIGRPLPGRMNIVVTRNDTYRKEGITVSPSVEMAVEIADGATLLDGVMYRLGYGHETNQNEKEIFIIGGGQIYQEAMPMIDRLYLTIVHKTDPDADVFFPEYEKEFTRIVEQEDHTSGDYSYSFVTLEK